MDFQFEDVGGGFSHICLIPAERVLALLLLRNRELLATRRRIFGFSALAVEMIERELLASRKEVLRVRSLGRNRSTRRLVQGDNQASIVVMGAG